MKSKVCEEIHALLKQIDSKLIILGVILSISLSLFFGLCNYKHQVAEFNMSQEIFQKELKSQPSWRMLSNYGIYLIKPITPVSLFSSSHTQNDGKLVNLERKAPPSFISKESDHNPYFKLFGKFNLTFVVIHIISLSIILLTYNQKRCDNVFSKLIAKLIVLSAPLVVFSFIGFLLAGNISSEGMFTFASWQSFLMIMLTYALYIVFFLSLSALTSLFVRNNSLCLVILIFMSVFLTNVLPALGHIISKQIHPTFYSELYFNKRIVRRSTVHEANQRSFEYFEKYKRGESVDELTEWTDQQGKRLFAFLYNSEQKENEKYRTRTNHQNRLAEAVSFFSPSFLVEYITASFSGTSAYASKEFLMAVEQYQPVFFDYILDKIEPESNRYKRAIPVDLTKAPQFKFLSSDLYAPFSKVSKHFVILLGADILLLISLMVFCKRQPLKESE